MKYYNLTTQQWIKIKELLPGTKGEVGRNAKNKRQFVEAILFRYKTGIPWGNLSNFFGDFRILNSRFSRWAKNGFWKMIFESLGQLPDNQFMMIDSTIVKAHQHSAGAIKNMQNDNKQAIGRSKAGLTTKIHTVCEAKGRSTAFYLTGGEAHDLQGADLLLDNINAPRLLADKAYDADYRVLKRLEKKTSKQ